jgi:thiosulfate dehydrogenase (quinone) large subunit
METKITRHFVLPVLLLIIAYEWLIATVDKLFTKNYVQNFHKAMAGSVGGVTLHPYANLVKSVGLPQYHVLAYLVPLAELFVGLTFAIFAIMKFQGKTNRGVSRVALVAAIIGAFMNLNYALLGGDTLFVDPANAFAESISIDWIMCLIEITFAVYFYSQSTAEASQTQRA